MKPWQYYANEMHTRWNFLVTWPPNQKLQLGDVGYLENNVFQRITSLDNMGISYNKKIRKGRFADEEFQSKGQVKVCNKFDLNGIPTSLPTKLGADVTISFQKENSVYYKAPRTRVLSIDDQLSLANQIAENYRSYRIGNEGSKEWQLKWAIVTDIHYAERATIIISNEKNAFVGLNAGVGATKLDILNLNCDLEATSSQGIETKILAEKSLTPLFNVLRLEEKIFEPLGGKRYFRAPKPGESGYAEYRRTKPVISYNAKKVEYDVFSENSNVTTSESL